MEYVDSLSDTRRGFAPTRPEARLEVRFSTLADRQLQGRDDASRLKENIERLLAVDPRPAYRRGEKSDRVYGMRLYDFDLRWRVQGWGIEVMELASPD